MEFDYDAEYIVAYRSMDNSEQKWMITYPNANHSENALFGGIVLEFLNNLRNILYCSADQCYFNKEMIGLLKENSNYLIGRMIELTDAILAKDSMNLKERYITYEMFKWFALEIDDYQFSVEDLEESKEYKKLLDTKIVFNGYKILGEKKYEVFQMPNASFLFALDLWNIFFQENMELKFKCCAYCNDFIGFSHNNQIYCPICKDIVNKNNKAKNHKERMEDPIIRMKDKITHRLTTTKKNAYDSRKLLNAFLSETAYIEARLNGKDMPFNPNYNNDVKTNDQYREWLRQYDDNTKIYKRNKDNQQSEVNNENNENTNSTELF